MASPAPDEALLVVLPISHFCEKARWALERVGVPYTLQAHPPGFHVPAVKKLGVSGSSTPVLRLPDGRVLDDSSLILRHCDELAARAGLPRLFPLGQAERVASLCAKFDDTLGKDVRAVVYSHALGHAEIRRSAAAPPVSARENFIWHYTGLSFLVT